MWTLSIQGRLQHAHFLRPGGGGEKEKCVREKQGDREVG